MNHTVLDLWIVDDEPAMCLGVTRALEDFSAAYEDLGESVRFNVTAMDSGEALLERLEREAPPPLKELMGAPYGRIMILHVTLIASGFLVQALGSPVAGALLLVGLKLAYDLVTLRRDRPKAQYPDARDSARLPVGDRTETSR